MSEIFTLFIDAVVLGDMSNGDELTVSHISIHRHHIAMLSAPPIYTDLPVCTISIRNAVILCLLNKQIPH